MRGGLGVGGGDGGGVFDHFREVRERVLWDDDFLEFDMRFEGFWWVGGMSRTSCWAIRTGWCCRTTVAGFGERTVREKSKSNRGPQDCVREYFEAMPR